MEDRPLPPRSQALSKRGRPDPVRAQQWNSARGGALEPLLEECVAAASESEKEADELKIDDIFDNVDVKVLFIQVGDSQREQLSGIVKEWNRGRNNKGEW